MSVRTAIAAFVLPLFVLIGGGAAYESAAPRPGAPSIAQGQMSVAEARAAEFPVYYTGDSVAGQPLRAILRGHNAGPVEDIDFVYGDCKPSVEQGCAPPVEIQVWPACIRNLSLYTPFGPGPLPRAVVPVKTTIRGVPAAFFESFTRLELQTGISTVVIFGKGYDELVAIAQGLKGLNLEVAARAPLPPPPSAALAGKLSCDSLT